MQAKTARAKQFLPFDALKGLQEALREKEIEYEERKELSEETLHELDDILNRIEIGDIVAIKYYKARREFFELSYRKYSEIKGRVTKIDVIKKKIQIDNENNINMVDVVSLSRY